MGAPCDAVGWVLCVTFSCMVNYFDHATLQTPSLFKQLNLCVLFFNVVDTAESTKLYSIIPCFAFSMDSDPYIKTELMLIVLIGVVISL